MIAALFAIALSLGPAGESELAESARREFRAGCDLRGDSAAARPHFANAARCYRELWQRGERSPELVQQWARSEFLNGALPAAIAAAHAGLRIAPHHAELQRDLETYRDGVVAPANAKPDERLRPDRIAGVRTRIGAWDFFGLASAGAGICSLGMFRRFTRGATWATPSIAVGIVMLMICGGLAWSRGIEMEADLAEPTTVLRRDEILRKGNGEAYPARIETPLPRGAEVRAVGRRGGWVQVRLAGGAMGWLPERALLPIP